MRYRIIEKRLKLLKYLFIAILVSGILAIITIKIISNTNDNIQELSSNTIYCTEEYKKSIEISAIGTDIVPCTYSILPLEANDCVQASISMNDIEFTDKEVDIIARVVMSESSIESYAVKVAVAKTVINRVRSDYNEFIILESVADVVVPGQFSTAYNGNITEECYNAVYDAIDDTSLPDDMYWFRNNYITYGYEYIVDTDSILKFSTVTNYN